MALCTLVFGGPRQRLELLNTTRCYLAIGCRLKDCRFHRLLFGFTISFCGENCCRVVRGAVRFRRFTEQVGGARNKGNENSEE